VRELIAEVLGPEQLDAVLAAERTTEEPVWPQIAGMKDQALQAYLTQQHPQAIAYILSQLPSARAATVLALLTSEQRNDLIGRMLTLGSVTEWVKVQVERSLREDLFKSSAAPSRPHGSIAGILNELEAPLTEAAITYLEGAVPEDAGIIRKLLFKFEDLPTLSAQSLTTLFDRIPVERIVVALQGLDAGLQTTILSALAPRARRLAESELTSGATAPAAEVTAARRAIVDMVLPMLANGELTLADATGVEPGAA
jgi:flagellar motor switch protein FliG